jgi:hypothetical protein
MEDKMKYIIPIIILSFVLLSCSKEEEGETDTTTVLEGTWKTACYTDSDNMTAIFTPTFAGNVLTLKDETHSDTSCATDYSLTENSHTFSMGDAGEFSITAGTTKRTPQSSAAVTAYNSASKCSANDWELNTVKDCTEADGNQGDPVYCSYQLSGNTLYVDCNSSTYPTSVDTSDAGNTFTKQ